MCSRRPDSRAKVMVEFSTYEPETATIQAAVLATTISRPK